MRIASCLPSGNGAFVIHRQLAEAIPGYRLVPYSPGLEYAPFLLSFVGRSILRDAEIVHATAENGLFFRRRGAALIVTAHNYVLDAEMRRYSTPLQRLHYATDLDLFERTTLGMADCVVCVSEFVAGMLGERYPLGDRIRVIRNGVDHRRFVPPAEPPAEDGPFRVLFSGNTTPRKGAQWLEGIASLLAPGIEIHYTAGLRGGRDLPRRPNLIPVGRVAHGDMPALYGRHGALLSPTVREGFGLGVAEAMACGLPVVASDTSFLPSLVEHGRGGFLCPVGDCRAFAEALDLLASSPSLRREMGAFNRARIEESFTLDRMLRGYSDLFGEWSGDGDR